MPKKLRPEMSRTFPPSSGVWKRRLNLPELRRRCVSDRRTDAAGSAFYRFRLDTHPDSHYSGHRFLRSRIPETTGLVWRAWSEGDPAHDAQASRPSDSLSLL